MKIRNPEPLKEIFSQSQKFKKNISKPLQDIMTDSELDLIKKPIYQNNHDLNAKIKIVPELDIYSLGVTLSCALHQMLSSVEKANLPSFAPIINLMRDHQRKMLSPDPNDRPTLEQSEIFYQEQLIKIKQLRRETSEVRKLFLETHKELAYYMHFVKSHNLKCPLSRIPATEPAAVMAQCLLDLANRRDELIEERDRRPTGFSSFFRANSKDKILKQEKIDGLNYLINELLVGMKLQETISVKNIIRATKIRYPRLTNGIISKKTKETLEKIENCYKEPPVTRNINQFSFLKCLSELNKITANTPATLGFKF